MAHAPPELVPENVSVNDMKDEGNRRTAKAGLTTRLGESPYATKIQTSVSFGKAKLNLWPRDKDGNLID